MWVCPGGDCSEFRVIRSNIIQRLYEWCHESEKLYGDCKGINE